MHRVERALGAIIAVLAAMGCGSPDCSDETRASSLESGTYVHTPSEGAARTMTIDRPTGSVTIVYEADGKQVVERYRFMAPPR